MNRCNVCFRHCLIQDGMTGFCRARTCIGGKIVCSNYGLITAIALDPIEKKPLMKFRPGSKILSVGSYGCNLSCSFCQNSDISMASQEILIPCGDNGSKNFLNGAANATKYTIYLGDHGTHEIGRAHV